MSNTDTVWRTCLLEACKHQFGVKGKTSDFLYCSMEHRQAGLSRAESKGSGWTASKAIAAADRKTAKNKASAWSAGQPARGTSQPSTKASPPSRTSTKASPPTPPVADVPSVAAASTEQETVESEESKELTERIDMLSQMIEQLRKQDVIKPCVAEQKTKLDLKIKALRYIRNSALPTTKQLLKANSRRSNALKAKEKAAVTLKQAEEAVANAISLQEIALKAHQTAIEKDEAADADVLRLTAVVRSEQGRTVAEPISGFVKQIEEALASINMPPEVQTGVIALIQNLAGKQRSRTSATVMETKADIPKATGIDHVAPRVGPAVVNQVVADTPSMPKRLNSGKLSELHIACPSKNGNGPALPPPLQSLSRHRHHQFHGL